MDIMHEYGFGLNLKQRILRIGTEELILHQKKDCCAQMILAEDVIILEGTTLGYLSL